MARYIIGRLGFALLTIWAICTITFFISVAAPGDPLTLAAGQHANPALLAQLRHKYGLDLPVGARYVRYLENLAHGDLGTTFSRHESVASLLAAEMPVTALLATAALATAVVVGIAAGVLAALWQNAWVDRLLTGCLVAGISLPNFVSGPLLVLLFSLKLGWLPVEGWGDPIDLVLPAFVLALRPAALIGRLTRSSLIETLAQDYIRTARAKGLSPARILFRHALRNSLLPVLTTAGVSFGYLLTGSFVVETIFRIPGIGFNAISALTSNDYPLIQGTTLVFACVYVLVSLVVDLLYRFLDPRMRVAEASG